MARRFLPIERIAKIKTQDLPIVHSANEPKEHYVYVREYDRQKQIYKVNVGTHLEKYDKKASLSIRYATIGRIRYPHRPQSGREKSVIGFTGRYSPFSLS